MLRSPFRTLGALSLLGVAAVLVSGLVPLASAAQVLIRLHITGVG